MSVPLVNEAGEPRRVGVEIEYAGVGLAPTATIIQALFGGVICAVNDYETVVDSDSGRFGVEIDHRQLKQLGQERAESGQPPGVLKQLQEQVLVSVAGEIIPYEIVTPPLPFERVGELDRLVERLRAAGAKGSDQGLLYAFGVHFNPEVPSTEASSIRDYLRAFLLLYPWLKQRLAVDISRRVTPFINSFPRHYTRQVLAPDYRPDLERLIADYIAANPSRNRALDLLPLFAELRPRQVFAMLDDPHIKARPTYHYRLGDSRVGSADWSLSQDWRCWLLVERLAQDRERLTAMAQAYLREADKPLSALTSLWSEQTEQWLHDYR